MDDVRARIFAEVWPRYEGALVGDGHGSLLDALYQEGLVDRGQYGELIRKTQQDLLQSAKTILISNSRGYEVFLKYLEHSFKWLHDLVQQIESDAKIKKAQFDSALIIGEIPRRPQYYIERSQPLLTIRENLHNLRPSESNKMVLYGMSGNGKSSLASAALRDEDLLLNRFNNKVFWINVGRVKDEQLLDHMYRLYSKILKLNKHMSHLPNTKPETVEEMKTNLLVLFQDTAYRNTLIILDNVYSERIVRSFDVGCSLLVISQEKIDIHEDTVIYFQVNDGFAEEESYRLFARVLGVPYENIKMLDGPSMIHSWCKGDPVLVSLCASLMESRKNSLIKKPKEWENFIKTIIKKRSSIVNKRFETIELCYSTLDEELRSKYQDFAIFVHDINMTPEVLAVLWDMTEGEVEAITEQLEKKCLIVSDDNMYRNTKVYGIHHIFLDFLKDKLSEETVQRSHRKLLKAYKSQAGGDYSKLPDDNYIFQYLGYHLAQAGWLDEFAVYFDLDFIGAKIKATGIADVLRDFTMYSDYITKMDEVLEDNLAHYIKFIEVFGENLYQYPNTDIIQSGLELPKDNPVYKAAYKLAVERCKKQLYFTMHAPYESNYHTHTLNVNEKFRSACFTAESNQILIGTESGTVEMWQPQYETLIRKFEGHLGSIVSLKLNIDCDKFLSISTDGTVKLWSIIPPRHLIDEVVQVPSPHLKQKNHQVFFGSDTRADNSDTYVVEDDVLISAAFCNKYSVTPLIATGSQKGLLVLWEGSDDKYSILVARSPVRCVEFSNDDALILAGCDCNMYLYSADNGEFIAMFHGKTGGPFNALHTIPNNDGGIIGVQDEVLTVWIWLHEWLADGKLCVKNCEMTKTLSCNLQAGAKFICSTVTDQYLVVCSSDGMIRMLDFMENKIVGEFAESAGQAICLDAYVDPRDNAIQILLTGFEDQTVKMWHVQPSYSGIETPIAGPNFAAYWKSNEAHLPLMAIPNGENMQVLMGHRVLAEVNPSAYVTNVTFVSCDEIYYGTSQGGVFRYKINCHQHTKVMSLQGSVEYLESFKGLIVASTNTGMLSVYYKNRCDMLIGLLDKALPPPPVTQKCYLISETKLLAIAKERIIIKCWDVKQPAESDVLYVSPTVDVSAKITSAMSSDESVLCVTSKGFLQIFCLANGDDALSITTMYTWNLPGQAITCCSISYKNQFLALGCENGIIVIWDVSKKSIYATLDMHRCPLRNLHFSPSDLVLISVSEQITFWDLKKHPGDNSRANSERRSTRSRSNSARFSCSPLKLDLSDLLSATSIGIEWTQKRGAGSRPYLLNSIKLHGKWADRVSYSRDFESFLTIDDLGKIYIMDVLNDRPPSS